MSKTKTSLLERSDVQLHGWDSQAESWHGPIPLTPSRRAARLALAAVRSARGAFHGRLRTSVPGLPCIDFYTSVYDLTDAGLAVVHLDWTGGGPAGIVAAIPRTRRRLLRNDFAFEFMTLISFLGSPVISGSELAIHDYIDETLRTEPALTQVFAVETAELDSDTGIVLAAHFETVAAAMLDWLAIREPQDDAVLAGDCSKAPIIVPVGAPAVLPARDPVVLAAPLPDPLILGPTPRKDVPVAGLIIADSTAPNGAVR